jgi:hypothetical protein
VGIEGWVTLPAAAFYWFIKNMRFQAIQVATVYCTESLPYRMSVQHIPQLGTHLEAAEFFR